MPTSSQLNKHYLSRNKSIENTQGYIQNATRFVSEVAQELVEDAKYYAQVNVPTTQGASSIPIPPPLPTREMMHKHYLIPKAPAMPTEESTNVHYLSRNKTLENTGSMFRSAANYVSEVAHELVEDAKYYAHIPTQQSSSSIPIPPPLPTREMMHKYLIPKAPAAPRMETLNKHYLSRNKTLENTGSMFRSAANYVSEVAHELVEDAKYYAHIPTQQSSSSIPIPPPLPTREMMHKHYLIPKAPAAPRMETLNKHYLSRNKTLENTGSMFQSAAHFVSEVAQELVEDAKYYAHAATTPLPSVVPTARGSSIPIPPPLPTREMMHKHYLVPRAPPMPTSSQLNKHYLSRNKSIENTQGYIQNATRFVSEVAQELVEDAKYYAQVNVPTTQGASSIPIPPPLPTREMMHKHYLIPKAPAMPTEESTNAHYLSRNKTVEKTGGYIHNAAVYMKEVIEDVKEYINESTEELQPNLASVLPAMTSSPSESSSIPQAPPMPTKEMMNKHYLSRNRSIENAQSFLKKAAYNIAEIVEDATGYVALKGKEGYEALPTSAELSYVASEAKGAVVERTMNTVHSVEETLEVAKESVEEKYTDAKEFVVEKAIELKEAVLPTQTLAKREIHIPYARWEVLDESSIFKNQIPKAYYNRRILPRSSSQQDSILGNKFEISTLEEKLNEVLSHRESKKTMYDYCGNLSFMPHKQQEIQWSTVEASL
eukprot:TRINITY_DN73_c0_g1_i3.p1 TRINITY_DN73_c0_g1~~TRINITY_DN73_c0_g1_i3.p1  ORF type:complete len:712 (-),score=239.53 TRINITY_DN73_c0_g1_i3:132-2267(-)